MAALISTGCSLALDGSESRRLWMVDCVRDWRPDRHWSQESHCLRIDISLSPPVFMSKSSGMSTPIGAQFARGYVALIRSIPLILVPFWFSFWSLMNNGRPVPIGGIWMAFITFSLFEAAYYSEIIRVGLRSLDKGQYEAARALSLSTYKTYRFVILPQVVRVASPTILRRKPQQADFQNSLQRSVHPVV
ncbi:ABC transporter permease subunit [Mesorhizobium sp. M0809]|uniref:ABC transporter permease subunit n=1 Tax=Mesorhizobium sp. M0809 TaxID=2957003 RepID=UPI00333965F8